MSPQSPTPLAFLLALTSTLLSSTHAIPSDSDPVAVSLNSFTPRLTNLPSTCDTVYRQEIPGCTPDDFLSKDCSTSCINGLVLIQKSVQENCKDANVDGNSVIGVFRKGSGIPYVCDNVVVTTQVSSTSPATSAPAQASSSAAGEQPQSSAQESQSQTSQAQSSQAPSSTAANSISSSASSTGGIAIDTSVPSTFATSQPAGSATSTAPDAQSTNTQKSNQDSGGGSPFDVQAVSGAARVRTAVGVLLGVAAVVCAVL